MSTTQPNPTKQGDSPVQADDNPEFSHWRLESDIDDVTWLTIDRSGESVNSLSRELLQELEIIVGHLEARPPRGLVLQSGKDASFIVGADVREFDIVKNAQEATDFIRQVHQLFNRIESLPFPTVAAIEGHCLGGGLELALACDYRVARDVDHTRLGFPEVQLGVYPGFGGSARATALIGGRKALPMMLSGRMLRARQARSLGLLDLLVGRHQELRWAARRAVLSNRRARRAGVLTRLSDTNPARKLLAGFMRKQVSKKANPLHYPAPFELIDAWENHGNNPTGMMEQEALRVGQLITGETSVNLRRVFWLMERLKRQGGNCDVDFRRVHVIGAGVMGGDIAAWCACQGLEVTLQDREMKYIKPALQRAEKLFRHKLKTADRIAGAKSRLRADVEGKGVARADVIIEAVFEDIDAKRSIFREVGQRAKPSALLATNTSAIPLSELNQVLDAPERLIGLHFFNPVAKMPLIEVVHDAASEEAAMAQGAAFCRRINRFPLPVKSSPGFLVNRVLAPYMLKALQLHRERDLPIEALDQAATDFGMPMGPVELADTVGLDVGLSVMTLLNDDASGSQAAELIESYIDKGWLGKKTGRGFYVWKKGKPQKKKHSPNGINLNSLGQELMSAYLDECERCLVDEIAQDADMIDAGMIFGTGFAPFRGGPLHYLKQADARDLETGNGAESPDNGEASCNE